MTRAAFATLATVLATTWASSAWAVVRTPEIDPGALRTALVLLAGGVLVLSDRYRRR